MEKLRIITAIRNAAHRLESGTHYQWGHMGACNCGYITQEVTKLTQEEIHRKAMVRHGDWSEQLNDYCPSSGLPMDDLISKLINFGFNLDELANLERLSDQRVLQALPLEKRDLQFNIKADVITYMRTWATMLEEELLSKVQLPLGLTSLASKQETKTEVEESPFF